MAMNFENFLTILYKAAGPETLLVPCVPIMRGVVALIGHSSFQGD